MASGAGALAAEAPPLARPSANTPPGSLASPDGIARLPKRQRESESASPRAQAAQAAQAFNPLGSPTKSARLALATTGSKSPPPLTGAAALQDERWRRRDESAPASPAPTSPNPSHRILESLMSAATQAMSRPADAPQVAPTANMDPTAKAVSALSIPPSGPARADDRAESSPQSASSMVGVPVTESPTPMDVDGGKADQLSAQQVAGHDERPQPGSLSYPGSLQTPGAVTDQSMRGMSFPAPGQIQGSPTSTGGKKHRCPYCQTEFTRHHNLKSHLLTHSQEKPYVCTECQMRFRRLHDLKRHGKLHTGEKPHVCPKCDRKFARGDALARHSKGAGGCAGRRASMGSFVEGDELDGAMGEGEETAMSGITYENGDDEELRRQSLPSLGSQHAPGAQGDAYNAHSRTYPPAGPRPAAGGLYPPNVNPGQAAAGNSGTSSLPSSLASSNTANTSTSSGPPGGGNTGLFSQSGMTESPKPLSPGAQAHEPSSNVARQRSPSLTQQFQQHMARRPSELQSPHGGQPRPKLPGLSHPGFTAPGAAAYSHGRTPSGTQPSGDSGNMFAQSDPNVWAYIQTLEDKVKFLADKVTLLEHEVLGRKKQHENRESRDGAAAST
ncbi:hypothetical protein CDD83_8337 [Cordyceps sp. RAO-2017]|nr:hypothetical protein CDD83_8337 [Cordyceps sp. RAO-2017]